MPERPDELTLRILARIADGATTSETAAACNISESTLNRRLLALRRQWELENNVQVLVRAVRIGLV